MRAISSVGRVPRLHRESQRFKSVIAQGRLSSYQSKMDQTPIPFARYNLFVLWRRCVQFTKTCKLGMLAFPLIIDGSWSCRERDGCLSGLKSRSWKPKYSEEYRGFESLSIRHKLAFPLGVSQRFLSVMSRAEPAGVKRDFSTPGSIGVRSALKRTRTSAFFWSR